MANLRRQFKVRTRLFLVTWAPLHHCSEDKQDWGSLGKVAKTMDLEAGFMGKVHRSLAVWHNEGEAPALCPRVLSCSLRDVLVGGCVDSHWGHWR